MSLPREGARTTHDGIVMSIPMNWGRSPQAIVPYRVHTQGQIEGACTAGTVRQTDQASYVEGSRIKACYGDEAATGGGVQFGTQGAECEPKTWSKTVKFEGKGVVGDGDEWWMNHKETWGKLTYPKDTKSYPTPERKDIEPRIQLAEYSPKGDGSSALARSPQGTQYAFVEPLIEAPLTEIPIIRPWTQPKVPTPGGRPPSPGGPGIMGPHDRPDRTLPEEMRPIEPARDPKPDPAPEPDDGRRTSRGCSSALICFDRNGYDRKEYDRQLKLQEDAINAKTPQQNVSDIDNYDESLRKLAKPFQRMAGNQYEEKNQDNFIAKYGEDKWDAHMKGLAAIHRLDMVAGGDPTDIAGMGNANINSAIGSQWTKGTFRERRYDLRAYAIEMSEKGCPMHVWLSICEADVA